MAWDDPYGTAAEYRARVGKSDNADDVDILEQIEAVSDLLNRRCHRQFNQSAANTVRTFSRAGPKAVAVTDLVSLDASGFKVDTTLDGSFDTTIANADLLLLPTMASEDPDPYTRIELHPKQTTITALPKAKHAIQITGTWGWSAVPKAIYEYVYALVRNWRDLQEGGYVGALENVDAAIRVSGEMARIVREVERLYARPRGVM